VGANLLARRQVIRYRVAWHTAFASGLAPTGIAVIYESCIHPLNVDHHGNKLQKASLADYGETSLWIANKRTT
jgi:hypothetical protein